MSRLFCTLVCLTSIAQVALSGTVLLSTHAPWPQTSLLLEACDFFGQHHYNSTVIALLEAALAHPPQTQQEEYNIVSKVARAHIHDDEATIVFPALEMHLAARLSAPAVHMLRHSEHKLKQHFDQGCTLEMGVVVVVGNRVVCSLIALQDALSSYQHSDEIARVLPHDVWLRKPDSAHAETYTIVVGKPAQSNANLFATLLSAVLSIQENWGVVFRPLDFNSQYANNSEIVIQGYGVELQIKNMEYSVLDDQHIHAQGTVIDVEDSESEEEDLDLEGFNFAKLVHRRPDKAAQLRQFRKHLITQARAVVQTDEDKVNVWKLKDLGLQAAAKALQSRDALASVKEIACNFPVWASTLVRKRVPRRLQEEVQANQRHTPASNTQLTINNRQIKLSADMGMSHSPSYSLISLSSILSVVLEEHTAAVRLSQLAQVPVPTIVSLLSKPFTPLVGDESSRGFSASPIRFDTRVFNRAFLNDLSRDSMYRGGMWEQDVADMLKGQGEIRFVARNLYTMTLCIDPESSEGLLMAASLLPRLIRNGAPVRFALALIPDMSQPATAFQLTKATSAVASAFKSQDSSQNEIDKALKCLATHQCGADESQSSDSDSLPSSVGLRICAAAGFINKSYPKELTGFLVALAQVAQHKAPTKKQVTAAFTSSLPSAKRSQAKDILRDVLKSGEFISACEEARDKAEAYGLSGSPTHAFLNGVLMQQSYDMTLLPHLQQERTIVRELVSKGDISNDMDDIENAILEAIDVVVPRLNERLTTMPPEFVSMQHVASLYSHTKTSPAYLMAKPEAVPFKDTTLVVAADLKGIGSIRLIDSVLEFLQTKQGVDARFALLSTSACTSDIVGGCTLMNLWSGLSALPSRATASLLQTKQGLQSFQRIVRLILACAVGTWDSSVCTNIVTKELEQLCEFENIEGKECKKIATRMFSPTKEEINAEGMDAVESSNWANVLPKSCSLVVNGRIVRHACDLMSSDIDLIVTSERHQGLSTVFEALLDSHHSRNSHIQLSDSVMLLAAEFRKFQEKTGARVDIGSKLLAQESKVYWEGTSGINVVCIVDPVSIDAQWIVSIVQLLRDQFGCSVSLHLNPSLDLTSAPLNNFFRYVLNPSVTFAQSGSLAGDSASAVFTNLPSNFVLTTNVHTPPSWFVEAVSCVYDLDNLQLDTDTVVTAKFQLSELVITGHVNAQQWSPKGLQLVLWADNVGVASDTLVMDNLNYFQLKAHPNAYTLRIAPGRASSIFHIVDQDAVEVFVDSFDGTTVVLPVNKRAGKEHAELLAKDPDDTSADEETQGFWSSLANIIGSGFASSQQQIDDDDTVHIFSLASGHLYERFLRIMMVSVVNNTKGPVKFWLIRNFLSPSFKESLPSLAAHYNFSYALVTYKWPSWLHAQTEKQRFIWGLKILFLDVLFPIHLKKVIYIDADQTVFGDVRELWNLNLKNRPYGYVPFCNSNAETKGFRFWEQGFWVNYLRGKPYHISALYVVDLVRFRRIGAGDALRILYNQLSKDPNSLANLDQDLPNYAQHMVPIFSLPQEWLWCETWCSAASKKRAKTIDLCNNPMTKRPKLQAAKEIIGDLWTKYDDEIRAVLTGQAGATSTANDKQPSTPTKDSTQQTKIEL